MALSAEAPSEPVYDGGTPLRPVRAARRDWFRTGFWAAFGVAVLVFFALMVWRFAHACLDVIFPFAVGLILALLLDPWVDWLERRGLRRTPAAAVVFIGLLALIVGVSIVVTPLLISQATDLAQNGPQFVSSLTGAVNGFLSAHSHIGPVQLPATFQQLSDQLSGRASSLLQSSAGRLTGFLVGSVTLVIELVLALIVTFFLLVDIDRLRARLFFLAPARWRELMGEMGGDVGGVFADYLAGLLKVCALYGLATVILLYSLSLVHHDLAHYALLVGVVAGVLYSVPYAGSTATGLVTFLVAFAAASTGRHSGFPFACVAIGLTLVLNQVFDNIVTPRVVGGGVGLHPVLALFSLVIGGALFNIWGMLLSVPVAASIQVILFRLYPKLTQPTPPQFLEAQGVHLDEQESSKILQGDTSVTHDNEKREDQS